MDFNPRSPCGERPFEQIALADDQAFQSTLPVWGATAARDHYDKEDLFQSTLPVWGATLARDYPGAVADISIHAPRVGSDPTDKGLRGAFENFNPRSPCGERPR